jgi:hypothetical protein
MLALGRDVADEPEGTKMTHQRGETITVDRGEARALPATLAGTRSLSMRVVSTDPAAGTAVLELHNPQAEPDALVSGLIQQNVEDVGASNRLRDKLHLPEKAVPVDTSTAAVEELHCRVGERLRVGDRVWEVSAVTDGDVTLTAGRDQEADSLLNKVEDEEYAPEVLAAADRLNRLDQGL